MVRHAHARAVELAIERNNDTLALTLRDDGIGFGAKAGESGLANMRQRAAELGGTLWLDSAGGRDHAALGRADACRGLSESEA